MLLAESQSQGQDAQPPGLFQPVLGQVKNSELVHFSAQFNVFIYNKPLIINLYQDRLVGKTSESSFFFLLDDEIHFEKSSSRKQVKFVNNVTGHTQVFQTENSNNLEMFCDKLRVLCPQRGFHSCYQIQEKIGQGTNTQVFKARKILDGTTFAVKKCAYNKRIKKQLEILRDLKHPNLIYLHQYFIDDDHMTYLILDYQDGGNVLQLIRSNQMSAKLRHKLMRDILNGLQFLRIKQIIHRDLKPENILYSKISGNFKIADFGLAAHQNEQQYKIVGTPGYIAPELFKITKQTPLPASISSDIFSAGLIFYEAFTGKQYFDSDTQEGRLKANIKGYSYKSSQNDGQILKMQGQILRKMIRKDAKNRKNSYEIMKSKCMSQLNKVYNLDLKSVSTESPNKRNSNSSEQDEQNVFMAVKTLLKMRSSSN